MLVATIDRPGDDLNRVDARGPPRPHRAVRAAADASARPVRCCSPARVGPSRPAATSPGSRSCRNRGGSRSCGSTAKALIWDLLDVPMPIVCALNGHAVGLGASIALLCDAVFMAGSATIADPHVRVGLVAGDGGTVAWPLAVGPMLAKRYLLTGDPVTGGRGGLARAGHRSGARRRGARSRAWPSRDRLAAGAPLARAVHEAGRQRAREATRSAARSTSPPRSRSARSGSDDHAEALAALSREATTGVPGTVRSASVTELYDGLMTTRAMRRFTDEPVTDEEVERMPRGRGAGAERRQHPAVPVPRRHRRRAAGVDRRDLPAGVRPLRAGRARAVPADRGSRRGGVATSATGRCRDDLAETIGSAPVLVLVLAPRISMTRARRRRRDGRGPGPRQRVPGRAEPHAGGPVAGARHRASPPCTASTRPRCGRCATSPTATRSSPSCPSAAPPAAGASPPAAPRRSLTSWNTFGNKRR